MVSATRGCFGPRATMALHVMGLPSVDDIMVDNAIWALDDDFLDFRREADN